MQDIGIADDLITDLHNYKESHAFSQQGAKQYYANHNKRCLGSADQSWRNTLLSANRVQPSIFCFYIVFS